MGRRTRRLRRKIRDTIARLWTALSGGGGANTRPPRLQRNRLRVRKHPAELQFNISSTWAWSLRIYDGSSLLGAMQAASPLSCLAVIEPYFAAGGEPKAPYRLLLCSNSNHRQLKLDRHSYPQLRGATAEQPTPELLRFLEDRFDRELRSISDSSCITVMTDGDGEVIDSRALLGRVFGLASDR